MWEKIGLILDEEAIATFSTSHAAIPVIHRMQDGQYKLFFASRDAQSRSHIFSADMDFSRGIPTVAISTIRNVMGLGSLGAFDDSGVMPSCIIDVEDRLYMYYSGWSLGKTVPFYFYIGLAQSLDGGKRFTRVSRSPVLGRTDIDPYLTASACVIKEEALWKMWYISGKCWQKQVDGLKHYYFIRYAHSTDGIHWIPREEPCIDFASDGEYAMARPCVVPIKGGYAMWYSYRGDAYRLGLAISRDGLTWKRMDHAVGIDVGDQGWDSQMLEYAHVFEANGQWWMLYNGNAYGKTGIGLARAKQLPSFAQQFQQL